MTLNQHYPIPYRMNLIELLYSQLAGHDEMRMAKWKERLRCGIHTPVLAFLGAMYDWQHRASIKMR
jgi:hypothetical protein